MTNQCEFGIQKFHTKLRENYFVCRIINSSVFISAVVCGLGVKVADL
jgi:hypothetical protein